MSCRVTGRLLIAAAALAMSVPFLAVTASAQRYGGYATPIAPLNLRAGPSDGAPVIGVLPRGMPLRTGVTTPGGWTNVITPEGPGWAYDGYLASPD